MNATITFDDMEEGWPLLLKYTLETGRIVKPRGFVTREVGPVLFTLRDPSKAVLHSDARKLNHAFSAVEFLWVVSGQDEVETLAFFNSRMRDFADVIGSTGRTLLFGAYGPPLVEQLPYVLANLRKDPDSRQAVVTIWRPSPPPTKDVPCTVSLQFLLRGGKLSLFTVMRSNDLFLGTPYDVALFCRVLYYVASQLGVEVGEYHHAAGSLHVYERDIYALQPALAPHHVGLRPYELVVGPFNPTTSPSWAWSSVLDVVDDAPVSAGLDRYGEGWATLLKIAWDYAERKRARESNG